MQDIALRDIKIGDAGWLIQRHAECYAAAEQFDASFELLVADIVVDFLRNRDLTCERAWIAESGDARLGSIFCVRGARPRQAKLRLFFLEPTARGRGLGRRLLETCLAYARDKGYAQMTLSTHASHTAACALYAKSGFTLEARRPVRAFGVDLEEQDWVLSLR
ncbi:MAG: GNAT family N-acetyltransferase [Pseudomonadota bacterium]